MRKWTYLVAMLMLAGATTTFTGCIDTDEPAGIEELRGAKAKLLEAKMAVEAAIAAEKQANAALTLAQAKSEEARAAWEAANAKVKEEEAKQAALTTELQAAQNEAAKAEIQAEIAQSKADQAAAENAMAEAAKQHEVTMKDLETSLKQSELLYLEAEKNLALAGATLTTEEAAALEAAKSALAAAKSTLETEETDLYNANKALYEAMLADEYSNLESKLNYNVKLAQYKLDAAKQTETLAKENSEKDVEATDWEKELEKIKAHANAQKLFEDSLDVELEKIHIANKAAWDSVMIQKNDFWNRINSQEGYEYAFSEYENNTLDSFPAVADLLNDNNVSVNYSYDETTFDVVTYFNGFKGTHGSEDLGLIEPKILVDSVEGSTSAKNFIADFDTKIEALENAKRTLNELIKDTLDKEHEAEWDKDIAKADSTFKADSLEWTILVAAMKGEKTEPTALITEYMKAVDAYNAKYAQVADSVAAQNAAVEAVKAAENAVAVAAYNTEIAALEDSFKTVIYLTETETAKVIRDSLTKANLYDAWIALGVKNQTKAQADMWLSAAAKTKLAALTDSIWKADWTKDKTKDPYLTKIETPAKNTKVAAIKADIAKDKNSTIKAAYAQYETAVGFVTTLEASLSEKLQDHGAALDTYKELLASEYAQVLSGADTLSHTGLKLDSDAIGCLNKKGTTKDSTYVVDAATKAALGLTDGTLHYVGANAKSTNISAAEIEDLKTTELMAYSDIQSYWETKSEEAWGTDDRMLPMTEEEITEAQITSGSLYALMQAKQAKADMQEQLGANAVIDRLIAELTAQKAVAEGELNAVIEATEAVYADYVTKIEAYATLDDDIQAQIEAAQHLTNNYNRIKSKLEDAIASYYAGPNGTYTYTDLDGDSHKVTDAASMKEYLFFEYLNAQYNVITAESILLEEQKALEEYNDGLYDAVSEANRGVEKATEAYEAAKKEYEAALEALNKLLAIFSAE